jgi:hypothetical protein
VAAGAVSVIAAEVAVTETELSKMLHVPVMAATATSAMVATAATSAVLSKKSKAEPEKSSHCLPFSSSSSLFFLVVRRSPELAFALVGREVLITCLESKQMIQQLILFH